MSRVSLIRCDIDAAPVEEGGQTIMVSGGTVDVCASCLATKTAGDLATAIASVRPGAVTAPWSSERTGSPTRR